MKSHLHNFVTGKTDYREAPTADEEAKQYLPQDPSVLNLYSIYRQMGDSVLDAYIKVLKKATGWKETP